MLSITEINVFIQREKKNQRKKKTFILSAREKKDQREKKKRSAREKKTLILSAREKNFYLISEGKKIISEKKLNFISPARKFF